MLQHNILSVSFIYAVKCTDFYTWFVNNQHMRTRKINYPLCVIFLSKIHEL